MADPGEFWREHKVILVLTLTLGAMIASMFIVIWIRTDSFGETWKQNPHKAPIWFQILVTPIVTKSENEQFHLRRQESFSTLSSLRNLSEQSSFHYTTSQDVHAKAISKKMQDTLNKEHRNTTIIVRNSDVTAGILHKTRKAKKIVSHTSPVTGRSRIERRKITTLRIEPTTENAFHLEGDIIIFHRENLTKEEGKRFCKDQSSVLLYFKESLDQILLWNHIFNYNITHKNGSYRRCAYVWLDYEDKAMAANDKEDDYSIDYEFPLAVSMTCIVINTSSGKTSKVSCDDEFDCMLCESVSQKRCDDMIPPCYFPRLKNTDFEGAHSECVREFDGHLADISFKTNWKEISSRVHDDRKVLGKCNKMLLGREQPVKDFQTPKGLKLPTLFAFQKNFLYGTSSLRCLAMDVKNSFQVVPINCHSSICVSCRQQ